MAIRRVATIYNLHNLPQSHWAAWEVRNGTFTSNGRRVQQWGEGARSNGPTKSPVSWKLLNLKVCFCSKSLRQGCVQEQNTKMALPQMNQCGNIRPSHSALLQLETARRINCQIYCRKKSRLQFCIVSPPNYKCHSPSVLWFLLLSMHS